MPNTVREVDRFKVKADVGEGEGNWAFRRPSFPLTRNQSYNEIQ
jgi:hypothetical protein